MKREYVRIASIILMIVSLAACGKSVEPTQAPVDPGNVVLPTAQPGDPCANEYFPIKNEATYTYSSTGSPSGPYSFFRTINNIRADGFTIVTNYKNQNLVQEWSCKSEGLVPTQLGATDVTSILAFEKFTNLTGTNIIGFVFPPVISPGAEWTYALDIQGTEKVLEGSPAFMTGRVSFSYVTGNKESVTVPAGTFDAISIEVSTVIDFNIDSGGTIATLSIDSTYNIWYAPGIGWVKSNGYGKLGGQDYVETIVLESYKIP